MLQKSGEKAGYNTGKRLFCNMCFPPRFDAPAKSGQDDAKISGLDLWEANPLTNQKLLISGPDKEISDLG